MCFANVVIVTSKGVYDDTFYNTVSLGGTDHVHISFTYGHGKWGSFPVFAIPRRGNVSDLKTNAG